MKLRGAPRSFQTWGSVQRTSRFNPSHDRTIQISIYATGSSRREKFARLRGEVCDDSVPDGFPTATSPVHKEHSDNGGE